MTKQQQDELIARIQQMGSRQLEALKRTISISDANSKVKDRLMNAVDERDGRLKRIDGAIAEMSELRTGEVDA